MKLQCFKECIKAANNVGHMGTFKELEINVKQNRWRIENVAS